MAHGGAKITVPVGAVDGIALVEKHGEGYVGQVITWPGHVLVTEFDVDTVLPGNGGVLPGAGGNHEGINQGVAFESIYHLVGQININPAASISGTGYTG